MDEVKVSDINMTKKPSIGKHGSLPNGKADGELNRETIKFDAKEIEKSYQNLQRLGDNSLSGLLDGLLKGFKGAEQKTSPNEQKEEKPKPQAEPKYDEEELKKALKNLPF